MTWEIWAVFFLLFAPFAIFVLALRFIPQSTRARMFSVRLPFFNALPEAARRYLVTAMFWGAACGLGFAFGDLHHLHFDWAFGLGALFFLGAAFGHWEAARKARADSSVSAS
jgi:hypothetical protein